MSELEFPKSISFAEVNDLPKHQEYLNKIEERKKAKFVEGFVLKEIENPDEEFSFYAEVNIGNSKLWNLFIQLTELLPDICSCLFCYYDDELKYGEYKSKELTLAILTSLRKELSEDCFLEFGLIHNSEGSLIEIYIAESKFIKIWGVDSHQFKEMMNVNNIPELDKMSFIDEFPKVVKALTQIDKSAKPTYEVIELLEKAFITE